MVGNTVTLIHWLLLRMFELNVHFHSSQNLKIVGSYLGYQVLPMFQWRKPESCPININMWSPTFLWFYFSQLFFMKSLLTKCNNILLSCSTHTLFHVLLSGMIESSFCFVLFYFVNILLCDIALWIWKCNHVTPLIYHMSLASCPFFFFSET